MSRANLLATIVDPLRLDEQMCFPLYAAANTIIRVYRPLLKPLGLTYPQYLVMLVLWESAPLAVGEIGARLFLDSGTLTPLLKRLELGGLLVRRRDRRDERRVNIVLTVTGRQLKAKARAVPAALACRVLVAPINAQRLRRDLKAFIAVLN